MIDDFSTVFGLEDVAFLAVGNLQDFICEGFHPGFARAGVLRTEVLVLHHPFADEAFRWHFFCAADFPEAFTDGEFFEDVLSCLLPPLRFTGH